MLDLLLNLPLFICCNYSGSGKPSEVDCGSGAGVDEHCASQDWIIR